MACGACASCGCKKEMGFYTYRQNSAIRRREWRLRKYQKWWARAAVENALDRQAHFRAAKELRIEQGDATFVLCRDWARFGDSIAAAEE